MQPRCLSQAGPRPPPLPLASCPRDSTYESGTVRAAAAIAPCHLGGPASAASPRDSVAAREHCAYCFEVLCAHFAHAVCPTARFRTDISCPLFVTWNKRVGSSSQFKLRGCIGCLRPLPLTSLRDYALNSALHDRRFPPVQQCELPALQCTVQLLGSFESCGVYEWTIGVHGVTVSFVDGSGASRSAVYLPDVMPEQGWTHQETIDSLIRKSGCNQPITDQLRASLDVQRFVSTKHSLLYEECLRWVSPPEATPYPVLHAILPAFAAAPLSTSPPLATQPALHAVPPTFTAATLSSTTSPPLSTRGSLGACSSRHAAPDSSQPRIATTAAMASSVPTAFASTSSCAYSAPCSTETVSQLPPPIGRSQPPSS